MDCEAGESAGVKKRFRIADCGLTRVEHPSTKPELSPAVRGKLGAVRRRIRAYVWLEGIAILVALLGLAFWLGMGLDWLFEPSPQVRRVGLVVVGCAALYVVYRYLLRRAFVPVSDTAAALLLERRFSRLQDHVITAVDVAAAPQHAAEYHPELVARTTQAAEAAVGDIPVAKIFNHGPLVRAAIAAGVLAVSIGVLAIGARDVFGFWLDRLAMSEEPWPRRVRLEVLGFPPDDHGRRTHKLALDDDLELLVHADTTGGFEAPDEVEIRFRLTDRAAGGVVRRGRDTLIRVGDASANKGDQQLFRYEFKHVTGEMDFDVVGGDDRVRDLHLQVVDRPELHGIELECVYPEYLQRPPRRLPVTGGMRIPEGTRLVLHAKSTKPLAAARVRGSNDKEEKPLELSSGSGQEIQWEYGTLTADDVLVVSVTDVDGVASREPYRVSLSAVKDEVPQVAVRLAGIGSAVTPEAVLPLVGKITDDYGLDRVWFEYRVDGGDAQTTLLVQQPSGEPALEKIDAFDLRATDTQTGQRALVLKPKQRLMLALKAGDRYNLSDEPRAGSSQQFMLDVVTVADLLALMERRELALRQRFEAIYEKLTDTRNLMSRVESSDTAPDTAETPAADAAAKEDEKAASSSTAPSDAAQRMLSRRRLRVAGALQNVVQAADEVKGVAEAFDDLGSELTNNRIDNPDLKSRLGEQIAQPLHQIAEQRMPELIKQLKLVEERLADPAATAAEMRKAIAQADEILVAMQQVLEKMLELETYNEVVALLRGIITDQDEINRRTKERQKEKLKGLFEK
jgi:hypothetical protein